MFLVTSMSLKSASSAALNLTVSLLSVERGAVDRDGDGIGVLDARGRRRSPCCSPVWICVERRRNAARLVAGGAVGGRRPGPSAGASRRMMVFSASVGRVVGRLFAFLGHRSLRAGHRVAALAGRGREVRVGQDLVQLALVAGDAVRHGLRVRELHRVRHVHVVHHGRVVRVQLLLFVGQELRAPLPRRAARYSAAFSGLSTSSCHS